MKKLLFTLLFALPVMAVAQTNQLEVTASATINATTALDPGQTQANLQFGTIDNSNIAVSFLATNGDITGNATTVQRATAAVTGATGDVQFQVPNAVTITDGTNNMEVVLNFATANTIAATIGTSATPSSGNINVTPGGTGTDEAKLFIGGSISGTEKNGKPSGSYTGTVTISIVQL